MSEELIKNLQKQAKNDKKLPRFLKYIGKISSVAEYDDYIKSQIFIPLFEWTMQVLVIRPLVLLCMFFLCLLAIQISLPPIDVLFLAEGTSLIWFLVIEFINELRGEQNGKRK